MLPLLQIAVLCAGVIGLGDPKDEARQFLENCRAGKFVAAAANFDAKMSEVLPPAKLAELWAKLDTQLGKIEEMGPARVDKVQASTRVKIRCAFKTSPLDALVSFNAEGKIEGFFLVPAEKDKAKKDASPPYVDPSKFTEEQVTVGARGWPLPGTLSRPKSPIPAPLVVLVHGSGPNDRDETIGPNAPFRDIAHGLASRGIAVLRYDKRTFAHKQRYVDPKLVAAITVEQEVTEDALATLEKARSLSGIDPRRVFLLGHSEGGTVAPLIAKRDGKLAGVILMAASNRPMDEVLREQLAYVGSVDPSQAKETAKILKEVEDGFARIKAGKAKDDEMIMGGSVRFWKSWEILQPGQTLASLKGLPALLLQGGRDYQVTKADLDGLRPALRGRPNSAVHVYPDLNHCFQIGKGKATPSEYLKPAFVDARVIEDLSRWVKSVQGSTARSERAAAATH